MSCRLDTARLRESGMVMVVGCGGTGSFVAEGLCRLLLGTNQAVVLVDHDRVEAHNLYRQNFYPDELGEFKSQALAERLSRKFQKAVGYAANPFSAGLVSGNLLLIGCVDNGLARSAIAQVMASKFWFNWWIDAGNGDNWGQVLIGNADLKHLQNSFDPKQEVCHALPLSTIQQPELLAGKPAAALSCAQAVEQEEQSPVINQAMAAVVLEVVRRMLCGNCRWMQLYLDLENGTLQTVDATPQAVARITGLKTKHLIKRERRQL